MSGQRHISPMSPESVKRLFDDGSAVVRSSSPSCRLSDSRSNRPFSIDSYYYYYS